MNSLSNPVVVREVGLRDGLQSIDQIVPTAQKIEWIREAYAAGEREIEVGSFVPARLLPQLADTAELVPSRQTCRGFSCRCSCPTSKAPSVRSKSGADLMLVPLSASRAHSLANLRKAPDEVVRKSRGIRAARDEAGSQCVIEVGISTAFGCTIQGRVEPAEVLRLVQAALDAGVDRVGLADTVGYADPLMVGDCSSRPRASPAIDWHADIFTTRADLAWRTSIAAWQAGIRRFDACFAASAAARTHRAQAATSPPRMSPISSPAWALQPDWISTA